MGFVHDINSYRAEVQLIRENCLSTRFGAGAITSSLRVALVYMILLQLLPQVRGEDTSLEFFETKIRPALVTY